MQCPSTSTHWYSFCRPWKDDRLSQPPGVLIQWPTGLELRTEGSQATTLTSKPTPGSVSIKCGCMDMWLIFLMVILLTTFSQRRSLMIGGGQWVDHMPHGCSRLISFSRRWGWARHLPGEWPNGSPWSTGGKWMNVVIFGSIFIDMLS